MEVPTPRTAGQSLGNFLGRVVVLICDVSQAQPTGPSMFSVRTADGVDIFISLPPGESFQGCTFIQVEGKVAKPTFVEAMRILPVSSNFDVKNYNAALALAQGPYSSLFV